MPKLPFVKYGIAILGIVTAAACSQFNRETGPPTVAVIPESAGGLLWDVEHAGATAAAEKLNYHLYWIAPTSEIDTAGQVSLIDKVARGKYQGLVLAPNHEYAVLSPLRRVIAAGVPVVIVSEPVELPAGSKVGYVVNDDEKMGEFAAAEMAKRINGSGSIALVGLTRMMPGVGSRARSAERFLATNFPDIHVAGRLAGAYNALRAEQLTNDLVDAHPELKAVISFTAASTRAAHAVLKSRALQKAVTLVGCEQDADLIDYVGDGEIAALVAENTYLMGFRAVELIRASRSGAALPARSLVPPLLITNANINSAPARLFTGTALTAIGTSASR